MERCAALQRPVWQALALQDLTHLSQGGASEAWRRAAIFDDESGQSWSTAVQQCLGEVWLLNFIFAGSFSAALHALL